MKQVRTRDFIYTTDGFVDIIKVADVHLWDSDNEPRLWNEVKGMEKKGH